MSAYCWFEKHALCLGAFYTQALLHFVTARSECDVFATRLAWEVLLPSQRWGTLAGTVYGTFALSLAAMARVPEARLQAAQALVNGSRPLPAVAYDRCGGGGDASKRMRTRYKIEAMALEHLWHVLLGQPPVLPHPQQAVCSDVHPWG